MQKDEGLLVNDNEKGIHEFPVKNTTEVVRQGSSTMIPPSSHLVDIYAKLASLPMKHGFSPSVWNSCVDAILETLPGQPLIKTLRIIIILFDAQFNLALELVCGRRLFFMRMITESLDHPITVVDPADKFTAPCWKGRSSSSVHG